MEKLILTEKQYKALTWMNDVDGITNRIEGNELVLFYGVDPSYWEHRMSLEDAANIIHGVYDLAE